jgi:hypothetical protein
MHQLQNGALLVFAFFMISDPKTTPDAAIGRLVYSMLVAGVAFAIQFGRRRIRDPVCPVSTPRPDPRTHRHGTSCARDRLPVSGNDLSLEALR